MLAQSACQAGFGEIEVGVFLPGVGHQGEAARGAGNAGRKTEAAT